MQSSMSQKWQGRWQQLVAKAKQVWGELTDDELTKAEGDYERLIGLINERTGETREAIEKRLNA
jgi:uncharacterized protein YjbJ (UPF0337 family)